MTDEARCKEAMKRASAIFVFGSNLAGRHGKGAALVARQLYGARLGQGEGHAGRSYAIPTKDANLVPLRLALIRRHVLLFLGRAAIQPDYVYVVTKIGCGYAGYTEDDIRPMFRTAPPNCELPEGWRYEEHS